VPSAVLLALLIGVIAFRLTELQRLGTLIAAIRWKWLALALVLQAVTYFCTPLIWQRVLGRVTPPPTLLRLVPLALAKLFLDNAVPSGGVTGSAVVVDRLGRRGIARPLALAALLVDLISYYLAYTVAVATTLVVLGLRQRLPNFVLVLAGVFALIALAVPVIIFQLLSPHPRLAWATRLRPAAKLMALFRETPAALVRAPALLAVGALLRFTIFVLDAATLGVMLLALGAHASAGAVFAAFMVGSLAGTAGPLPGGLGSFEAGAVATLVLLGVPTERALAATLLTRGLTFWAPMLPGFLMLRHDLGGRVPGRPGPEAPAKAVLTTEV
jgi:uncharacterized protein (TIRG00374 family)